MTELAAAQSRLEEALRRLERTLEDIRFHDGTTSADRADAEGALAVLEAEHTQLIAAHDALLEAHKALRQAASAVANRLDSVISDIEETLAV